jgi:hypothetical protein
MGAADLPPEHVARVRVRQLVVAMICRHDFGPLPVRAALAVELAELVEAHALMIPVDEATSIDFAHGAARAQGKVLGAKEPAKPDPLPEIMCWTMDYQQRQRLLYTWARWTLWQVLVLPQRPLFGEAGRAWVKAMERLWPHWRAEAQRAFPPNLTFAWRTPDAQD